MVSLGVIVSARANATVRPMSVDGYGVWSGVMTILLMGLSFTPVG